MLMGHNAMDNNMADICFSGNQSGVRIQFRWCQDAGQVVSGVRVEGGVRGNVTTCVCLF